MDDDTTKIIKERFDALPKSIQDIIMSTNYEETLLGIGKQYQLNVEQLGILEKDTTMVMMGITPTKDFTNELIHELRVDETKGVQIVRDINEKIFSRIRELLKLMNTPKGQEPSTEGNSLDLGEYSPEKSGSESAKFSNTIAPKEEKADIKSNETKILNSAGIEIIPEKLELATPVKSAENREEMLKKIEKPETIHPILTQKLSGSFQTGVAKTEHTLENITKTNVGDPAGVKPKVDPYREIPE